MLKFQVKGTFIEFDETKLTPEVLSKVLQKGCSRIFFERETGKKDMTAEDFAKAVTAVQTDPNAYYASYGTRGEGVSRPKMSPVEKEASRYFSDEFFPAVKLALSGDTKAKPFLDLWKQAGADGVLLKMAKEATAEQKAAVNKNQDAKAKIIAAKVRRLVKDNWQPPTASLKGLEL